MTPFGSEALGVASEPVIGGERDGRSEEDEGELRIGAIPNW